MKRRQRIRKHERRAAHAAQSSRPLTLPHRSFPRVNRGHIVPAVYQRNFAAGQQVSVHFTGRYGCEIRNVKTAGTRGAFYRRTRPDGSEIDDIEASLSWIESKAGPVFAEMLGGATLTSERKSVLAQFFGVQMVRGPAFFRQRDTLVVDLAAELTPADFRPRAVAEAAGDVDIVRARVLQAQRSSTAKFSKMLGLGVKMGAVLGSMRWHLLDFGSPLLAYSDHPVVVWPAHTPFTEPFQVPHFGALNAVEVRVPLSSHLAILMTWSNLPDHGTAVAADRRFAGELNAFVVAAAEREWMHHPSVEPPVGVPGYRHFTPISRAFDLNYSAADVEQSPRRAFAAAWLHKVRRKNVVREIEIASVHWTPPA